MFTEVLTFDAQKTYISLIKKLIGDFFGQARALIDENLNVGITEVLKSDGIDAIHVNALGLAGASDREILDEAARQKRCVVTRNRNDFLELTKHFFSEGRPHHGVFIVPKSYHLKDYARIAHAIVWMVHNNPHAFQQYAFLFLPPQLNHN